MNGINLLLDSNHISKGNAFKAAQQITALNLSIGSLNYYISQALDIEAETEQGFQLPKIEDAETAKRILAYMAQTAIPKKVEKFDLKAYNVFLARVGLPVISFEPIDDEHVAMSFTPSFPNPPPEEDFAFDSEPDVAASEPVEAEEQVIQPVIEQSPIVFDIEPPTAIEVAASEALAPPVSTDKKAGRGRRSDPNSAVNVAKRLYAESADKSRDAILKLFQEKLGLESGTAMTYYYIARKQ